MAETQSTTTQTEATAPTGDIKIFLDAFNKDFDNLLKEYTDAQNNVINIWNDAIKISTPRSSTWPKDESVKTIGDLFKYTFPDPTTSTINLPPTPIITNYVSSTVDTQKAEDRKSFVADLENSKDPKIKEFYKKIKSAIYANKKLNHYKSLKNPGITNPSLWSPGQFYFDVFMLEVLDKSGPIFNKNSELNKTISEYGLTSSLSIFSTDTNTIESGTGTSSVLVKPGYAYFSEYVIKPVKESVESYTKITIDFYDNSSPDSDFPSLQTKYRSGLYEDLQKDPTFENYRGTLDEVKKEFIGNYENTLLYKAAIQAGDNYKPLVLPREKVESEVVTPVPISPPLPVIVEQNNNELTFNIEKTDTFIVVGGTVSPPLELVIVPNDGTEYIFNDAQISMDELSDEYTEGEFQGNEDDIWQPPPAEGYPSVNSDLLNELKGVDPNNPDALTTDTTSKYPVSKDKDANIKEVIKQAKKSGITNKFAITAILAIISKESGFVPKSELSYRNTSGARCIKIFGKRGKTEAEWDQLRKNDVSFFNFVYGNKYGNDWTNGYKYRGRGFNQITFKSIYEKYGKATGYDIINDPDLLNTVPVAAACAIEYFKTAIAGAPNSIRSQYNFTNINSFKNLNDATGAIYHANAGFGNSYATIVADSTGGRKKAFNAAGPLYNTYSSQMA